MGLLRALSVAVIEIISYSPELFSKLVLLSLASAEYQVGVDYYLCGY